MKLTTKQLETVIAVIEAMEKNFCMDSPIEDVASDDFFNWANEEDIRGQFNGKTVSGRMSSLMKKGVFIKDYVYEEKWVKVRRTLTLKEFKYPLWSFTNKDMLIECLDIQPGESINSAIARIKESF